MNCKKYQIQISAYVDGELSERDEKLLLKHLNDCSACRKQLESTRVLSNRLSDLDKIEGDIAGRNRVIANLREVLDKEPIRQKPVLFPWLTNTRLAWGSAVTVVAIVLIALLSMNNVNTPSTESENGIMQQNEFAMLEETLVDGLVDYLEQERIYAISNEAYAEPILAVFAYEPPPPSEGYVDSPVDIPIQSGG